MEVTTIQFSSTAEENKAIEKGTHIRCSCYNVIEIEKTHCPYCHKFNHATTAKQCPTCGLDLKIHDEIKAKDSEIIALNAKIVALEAQIEALKGQ